MTHDTMLLLVTSRYGNLTNFAQLPILTLEIDPKNFRSITQLVERSLEFELDHLTSPNLLSDLLLSISRLKYF